MRNYDPILLEYPLAPAIDLGKQKATWAINKKLLEKIEAKHLTFTAGDGTQYPVTPWIADEAEYNTLQSFAASADPTVLEEHRKKIKHTLESNPDIQANIQKLGISLDKAIQAVDEFTAQDCFMFDMHHRLLGKIDFSFGKGVHGRGYYYSPGYKLPDTSDIVLPIPELRISPGEPLDFLRRYHTMIKTLSENNYVSPGGMSLIVGNHVNFSFQIPNDGKYVGILKGLKPDDPYVNLFALAAVDQSAKAFVADALNGIRTVFQDADMIARPNYYDQPALPYDVGTSRGNIFRISRNRGEYRVGEGAIDHMADKVFCILKGAEMGIKKYAQVKTEIGFITACQVHFDRNSDDDPDRNHFLRRIIEGASLIEEEKGTYFLAINRNHFEGYSNKIQQELFGVPYNRSLDYMGVGSISSYFKFAEVEAVLRHVTVGEHGVSITEAVKYMRQHHKFPEDHIRHFVEAFGSIKGITLYPSFGTPLSDTDIPITEWSTRLRGLINSPIVKQVYGKDARPLIAETASKIIERVLLMSIFAEQEESTSQQSMRAVKEQFRGILKGYLRKNGSGWLAA